MKFTLTIGAMVLLLLHQFTAVAWTAKRAAGAAAGTLPDVGKVGLQLVGDAGVAVVVLLVITTLGVFKPWGGTPYGRRMLKSPPNETGLPLGLKIFLVILGLIIAAFVIVHLAGGGLGHHGG